LSIDTDTRYIRPGIPKPKWDFFRREKRIPQGPVIFTSRFVAWRSILPPAPPSGAIRSNYRKWPSIDQRDSRLDPDRADRRVERGIPNIWREDRCGEVEGGDRVTEVLSDGRA